MGSTEAGTPPKSEKGSSTMQEQTNIHAYPDWAAIQAYYGPGVSLPPPYFGSAVASGHPPHPYMWGPQPLMPPYGNPYAAIYSHGGVYAHPSMPIVSTPLTMETPAKSSGNEDRGLLKKLKSFDGLAVSVGSGNAENAAGSAMLRLSQSLECGNEGSSDGSDGNTVQERNRRHRKKSCEDMSGTGKDENANAHTDTAHGGEANPSSTRPLGVIVAQTSVAGKPVGTVPSPGITTGMEFRGSTNGKANVPPAAVVPAGDALSSGLWIQDERELKREKRKQSNRESARRSRLRKQAESGELAMKVESLNVENMALTSEINRLSENSEKLRIENSVLMEKLKHAQQAQGEAAPDKIETKGKTRKGIENLLSQINNNSSSRQRESENRENSSGKLHQLLESNPRADAVAAG
ncbi:common plant regulatory factor 1-like isoform X2 [Tasmannia lanceolata]|uniref:common plant regulatory factor 1-like isoform X2 n=1 Tax=Tasmannia lanceolata TaxID=3420 RepID=UPI004062F1B3